MLAAALLLLAYTLARPGPALVASGGPAARCGSARGPAARPPASGRWRPGTPAARRPSSSRRRAPGTARDTAFYNAGTAALDAGRLDVARGRTVRGREVVDPGICATVRSTTSASSRCSAPRPTRARATSCWTRPPTGSAEALLLEPSRPAPSGISSSPAAAAAATARGRRRRRQAASGGGGGQPSQPPSSRVAEPGLTQSQAEQILNSMDRQERETQAEQQRRCSRLRRRGEGLVIALLLAALRRSRPAAHARRAAWTEDRVMVGEEVTYRLGPPATRRRRWSSRSPRSPAWRPSPLGADRGLARRDGDAHHGAGGPAPRGASGPVAARPGPGGAGPDTVEAAALVSTSPPADAPATAAQSASAALLAGAPAAEAGTGRGGPHRLGRLGERGRTGGRDHGCVVSPRPAGPAPPPADAAAAGDRRVWSYPQSAPAGIAATRSIGGRWYDLFIAHQVVFPLLPGRVVIPRATLKYSMPVALQFFSQEERFALDSRADTLRSGRFPRTGARSASPAPSARRSGSSGGSHRASARVGEAVAVELALSGRRQHRRSGPRPSPAGPRRPRLRRPGGRAGTHQRGPPRRDEDLPLPRGARFGRARWCCPRATTCTSIRGARGFRSGALPAAR